MLRKKLAYYFTLSPFRFNFFLFGLLAWGAGWYIKHNYFISETFFAILLKFFLWFIIWFSAFVFVVALLSTLTCWLAYLIVRSNSRDKLSVTVGESIHAEAGEVPVTAELPRALRPLLGYVRARIVFSDLTLSGDIVLDSNKKQGNSFWRSGIKGTRRIWLRDRRDYLLSKGIISFQDMFRMFSFSYIEDLDKRMYTTPPQQQLSEIAVQPQRTEQEEVRIETLKKVEGEFLNYKNFESSDDVRRIVWKIYARNHELVVRVPEIMDPYASHINFFPSFYNGLGRSNTDKYNIEMLNLYKDRIRNIYESIHGQGAEVRYMPDQEIMKEFNVDESERIIYQVSTSKWQSDRDLRSYFNTTQSSVVCISSLVPADDVREMVEGKGSRPTVIWIKTSGALESMFPFSISRLFVSLPPNPINKLKRHWKLSGYRKNVLKNERALQQVLDEHSVQALVI